MILHVIDVRIHWTLISELGPGYRSQPGSAFVNTEQPACRLLSAAPSAPSEASFDCTVRSAEAWFSDIVKTCTDNLEAVDFAIYAVRKAVSAAEQLSPIGFGKSSRSATANHTFDEQGHYISAVAGRG